MGRPDRAEHQPAPGELHLPLHAAPRARRRLALRASRRDRGHRAGTPPRAPPLRRGEGRVPAARGSLGGGLQESVPERVGLRRKHRTRSQVPSLLESHARRDDQPRLRPGRTRSVRHQPHCLRDPVRREAPLFRGGGRHLRLRGGRAHGKRGARPRGVLLAPDRASTQGCGALGGGLRRRAERHDDRRRGEDHRAVRQRMVTRHPGGGDRPRDGCLRRCGTVGTRIDGRAGGELLRGPAATAGPRRADAVRVHRHGRQPRCIGKRAPRKAPFLGLRRRDRLRARVGRPRLALHGRAFGGAESTVRRRRSSARSAPRPATTTVRTPRTSP